MNTISWDPKNLHTSNSSRLQSLYKSAEDRLCDEICVREHFGSNFGTLYEDLQARYISGSNVETEHPDS